MRLATLAGIDAVRARRAAMHAAEEQAAPTTAVPL
jgi:hypothetical protein